MSDARDIMKGLVADALTLNAEGPKAKFTQNFTPVDPKVFMRSSYYSGFDSGDLYDFWVEEMSDFIEGDYNELIITGSLGSGKTTAANLALACKFYQLFSYDNINGYLGLPRLQQIYNIYFSVTGKQAERTGFAQFRSMIDASPWFKLNDPRRVGIDSVLEFRDAKFNMFAGSTHSHAIGMTVFATILDEADFFKKGGAAVDESYEQVTEMYAELADRRASRFQKQGEDKSFSILISSASFQSSFVAQRIAEAATNPKIKVIKAIGYAMKPKGTYSEQKFYVFSGHKSADPEILTTASEVNTLCARLQIPFASKEADSAPMDRVYAGLPPSVQEMIETPPVDFLEHYYRDLNKALMNHSGVFTARVGRLLQSRSILDNAYCSELEHPFSHEKIELSTGDDIQLSSYFFPGMLVHKERPHAIHIDQSVSQDSTGISMVRYDGTRDEDGRVSRVYTQVFSLCIDPPAPPNKIKISKTRDFVLWLSKTLNVNIVRVSTDQYQSIDSLQIMQEEGIKAVYQSIDRTDVAYRVWMQLLQDNAVRMYRYPTLEKEALDAIHDRRKGKVDHPKWSTIDVLQSFVGALNNLVKEEFEGEVDYDLQAKYQTPGSPFGNEGPVVIDQPFAYARRNRARQKAFSHIFGDD